MKFFDFNIFKSKTKQPLDTKQNQLDNNPLQHTNIAWKDTIEFVAPITGGVVIKVYDGDTITIASKLPYHDSPLYRFSVRLNGIDTPELKGTDISKEEHDCALAAKEFLSNLILNTYVTLKNLQNEKYGRILADVYSQDGTYINELLLTHKFAVKYHGGHKNKPDSWLHYKLTGEFLHL